MLGPVTGGCHGRDRRPGIGAGARRPMLEGLSTRDQYLLSFAAKNSLGTGHVGVCKSGGPGV